MADIFNRINEDERDKELPAIGDVVGGCQITEILGIGGMSVVYRAFEINLEIERAIKVLKPGVPANIRRRFDTEGKLTARLDHPNIVKILGSGITDKAALPYIKMELVDGRTLRKILEAYRSVHETVALSIVSIICDALSFASSQQFSNWGTTSEIICHRDIKPENIMITRSGITKVMDFGVAQTSNDKDKASLGTIFYMSPEQHTEGPVQASSDIYSIGMLLYEMLCGVKPFKAKEIDGLITEKSNKKYEQIEEHAPTAKKETVSIIEKCLEPLTQNRYQDYTSLKKECLRVLQDIIDMEAGDIIETFTRDPDNYKQFVYNKRKEMSVRKKTGNNRLYLKIPALLLVLSILLYGILKIVPLTKNIHKQKITEKKADTVTVVSRNDNRNDTGIISVTKNDSDKQLKSESRSESHGIKKDLPRQNVPVIKNEPVLREKIDRDSVAEVPAKSNTVIAFNAFNGKKYKEVISLLKDSLATISNRQTKDSAVIYLLESYYKLNQITNAIQFSKNNSVRDARYALINALLYIAADENEQAEKYFDAAVTYPSITGESVYDQIYVQKAKYYKSRFEKHQ
ncbi:MAG: serine/threonine protein kinase [Fibrobacter sp.]|nr:serine/threonine protein kinase [Fibrobacter sp.]